jgi:hypothetical protein
LLYDADTALVSWTYSPDGIQRLAQAGLLACWPDADDAPASEVLRSTRSRIAAMAHAGTLPSSGQRVLNCLATHPDPIGLIEETRYLLPSPTVATERSHPRHHEQEPAVHQPRPTRETRRHNTGPTGNRDAEEPSPSG